MFKYEMIAKDLQEKIETGVYQAEERLPQEAELCKIYDASRITIRQAMELLVYNGLIVRRRGSGSYVKSVMTDNKTGVSQSLQFRGFTKDIADGKVTSDLHEFKVVHPPEEVARQLNISPRAFTYYICRTRLVDGEPYVVEYTYMPIDVITGLTEEIPGRSIYDYIEDELKLKIESAHRTARAVMPTQQERQWLAIGEQEMPLLEVEQVAYLSDGRIFEYSTSRHRADRFALKTISIRA